MSVPASIKALPPSTVQLIGSSQVLLDASSVIKELVENALDAHATSIAIEVSANTFDSLQVRDNGHGIAPEERALVCKRHTTSKISQLSDLRELGGRSFGFRGEALHSLVEMCGELSVTTRTEGERVAVKLDIGKNGEVERYVSRYSFTQRYLL
jgi:DNA mismatch repair protein MutL